MLNVQRDFLSLANVPAQPGIFLFAIILLEQFFRNLHGIKRRALEQLIA